MKSDTRLEQIITYLTESHLELFGGYPHDYAWVGTTLVVADLDDRKERNQTMLKTYERRNLLEWYRRAKRFQDRSSGNRIRCMPVRNRRYLRL